MKLILVKKGEPVGFHQKPALSNQAHMTGKLEEIRSFIKEHPEYPFSSIKKVTGNCAPAGLYQAILRGK